MEDQAVVSPPKSLSGLSFTFSDDVIVEDEVIEESPKEPEAAKETVKESAESLVKEPETEGLNGYALTLKSFQVTDKLIPEDVEIPNNIDGAQFKQLLKEAIKKEVLSESAPDLEEREAAWINHLNEKGISDEQIEYSKSIALGVKEEVVNRVNQLKNLATAQLQNDEEREYVVRTKLALEGNSQKLIDTHIQTELSDEEKLKEAADEAQVVLGQMADQEFQAEKARALAEKTATEERIKTERIAFEKVIDEGFFGIKLSKEEAAIQKKYMFDRSVVKDIDTPQGKKRIAFSQETLDLQELEKDIEKRAFFSYLVRNGLQNAATTLHKKSADDFLKKIETKVVTPQKGEVISDEDEFITTLGKSIISIPNRR